MVTVKTVTVVLVLVAAIFEYEGTQDLINVLNRYGSWSNWTIVASLVASMLFLVAAAAYELVTRYSKLPKPPKRNLKS
jgi:hypothetical protein